MARYLVTGGCGFIGSHIADALVAAGHAVRILDNLSSGKRENLPAGAELVIADIRDFAAVTRCIEGVDGIFHLAAIASVEESRQRWLDCHAINLGGTIHLFEAARRVSPVPRIVYASSAAIYGDSGNLPLTETALPRPINAYGADKLGCELHARVASLLHGVPTIGLRLFNVYGPRQNPSSPYSGVVSVFVSRLERRTPITIYGDGRQVRDFIAVADVVAFFISAMIADRGFGEAFNACTGRGVSVQQLAEALASVMGVEPQIEYALPRRGDIRLSIGDSAAAARVLGRRSRYSLGEGLAQMLGRSWDRSESGAPTRQIGKRDTRNTARPEQLEISSAQGKP